MERKTAKRGGGKLRSTCHPSPPHHTTAATTTITMPFTPACNHFHSLVLLNTMQKGCCPFLKTTVEYGVWWGGVAWAASRTKQNNDFLQSSHSFLILRDWWPG
jgi:hypothetical protein